MKEQVRSAIQQLEEVIPSNDFERIQAAYDNLQNQAMEIGKNISGGAQQQQQEQPQAEQEEPPKDEQKADEGE